jgi:O-acetyl-ADP-ribose deacetylase
MGVLKIEIKQGSILELDCDALVNPANSYGLMGGGLALAIKRSGGKIIEEEAAAKAPIEVGSAVATSAGLLKFKAIIHAPTMKQPAELASKLNVALATRAALRLADSLNFSSLALPGMGTGVGKLAVEEAAEAMLSEILSFKATCLEFVTLCDLNANLITAWENCLRKLAC